MKPRSNRRTERLGVNAAQSLFESAGCIFQPVALENDYGKDAYLDFGDEQEVTGLCAALQIKSGPSFKTSSGYKIPCKASHVTIWEQSTVPVIGIVHDIDSRAMYWVNISEHLQGVDPSSKPTSIPVSTRCVLDETTIHTSLVDSVRRSGNIVKSTRALLNLVDHNEAVAAAAVIECLAIARFDIRSIVLLRRLLHRMDGAALRAAIYVLSCFTPHPDRCWNKKNWFADKYASRIRSHFIWTSEELVKMISAVDIESWQRGGEGQDVWMLIRENSTNYVTLRTSIGTMLDNGLEECAFISAMILIDRADDQMAEYSALISEFPLLLNHSYMSELRQTIEEHGGISFF